MPRAGLKTRFAPTPSGFLHAGNGIAFIVAAAIARAFEGKIALRIDDLDADRMREEYLADIFETLAWMGLDYDEGPVGVDDFLNRFSQHKRLDLYAEALNRLRTEGVLYACDCSRKSIREHSNDGLYPKTCFQKDVPFDAPEVAWRLQVPKGAFVFVSEWGKGATMYDASKMIGDFVVRQKNGLPAYQLASVVDDFHLGVNFIVRGQDLLASTVGQVYLAQQLRCFSFTDALFFHHPLLLNESGEKLSKSKGDLALKTWREAGKSPAFLFKKAAEWLGLPAESVEKLSDLVMLLRAQLPA